MTNQEAYAIGYVYGTVAKLLPDWDRSGDKYRRDCQRPITGIGAIFTEAHRRHAITPAIDEIVGEALADVSTDAADAATAEVPEPYLPLPQQGSWQLGYAAAQSGRPYYDIAKRREAAGMTQEQLAAELGVPQSTISRWESGKVRPRPDMMSHIKAAIK